MEVSSGRCLELARLACRAARRAGADQAEAGCGRGVALDVQLEESRLKSAGRHAEESLSVRAFRRGGRGAFAVHEITEAAARRAGRMAAALARAAAPDPDWRSLPGPEAAEEVEGLFDPRLAGARTAMVLELAGALLERAAAAAPGCKVSGSVGVSARGGAFANSLGLEHASRATSVSAGCLAVIRRGSQAGSFYDFDTGRRLADVDLPAAGAAAAEGAARYFGGRSLRPGPMPVVLGPLAAAALIESLAAAASAESIQRRRSFLTGMLGRRVASPLLHVADDGRVPAGLYSSARDSEGAPRRRLVVIADGVLAELLHNSYTAGKAGCRTNGHAAGRACAPTNLRPRPGEASAADIIRDTRRGLYVNSAAVVPNPSSGEVSAMVEFGLTIENGRLARPVANVNVAGRIFDLLADLDAVSSDYRQEPGNVMPTVRIRRMQVSGSG